MTPPRPVPPDAAVAVVAQAAAEEPEAPAPGIQYDVALHSPRPDTPFLGLAGMRVADFHAWAYLNLMVNTNRGVLAEFLVANALGVLETPRVEWNAFDLAYAGKRIEVKAGAYLQAWRQARLTAPVFGIAPRLPDSTVTGVPRVSQRNAHCYVFCLFTPTSHARANPADVENWRFYVLALGELPPEPQKTVGLAALARRGPPVTFAELRAAVDGAIARGGRGRFPSGHSGDAP